MISAKAFSLLCPTALLLFFYVRGDPGDGKEKSHRKQPLKAITIPTYVVQYARKLKLISRPYSADD